MKLLLTVILVSLITNLYSQFIPIDGENGHNMGRISFNQVGMKCVVIDESIGKTNFILFYNKDKFLKAINVKNIIKDETFNQLGKVVFHPEKSIIYFSTAINIFEYNYITEKVVNLFPDKLYDLSESKGVIDNKIFFKKRFIHGNPNRKDYRVIKDSLYSFNLETRKIEKIK